MKRLVLSLLLALCLCGCSTVKQPPNLVIVKDRALLGGYLGYYWPYSQTILLAPGANWDVLQHELNHHYHGRMGE